jgi:hypothetical protein
MQCSVKECGWVKVLFMYGINSASEGMKLVTINLGSSTPGGSRRQRIMHDSDTAFSAATFRYSTSATSWLGSLGSHGDAVR